MLHTLPTPRPTRRNECAERRPVRAAVLAAARPALRPLVAALLLGGWLVVAPGAALAQTPVPIGADPVSDADASIARLRQEADALAGRYFEALAGLADVQRRIDLIEGRIPALETQAATLREQTRTRAVTAYKRSGNDLGTILGAVDALDAARRTQWLDRLNARDDQVAGDLRATTARLAGQRIELRAARESAANGLEQVRVQGQAIDALLADAQERRRVAAAAAATPTTTSAAAPAPGPAPPPPSSPAAGPQLTTTTTRPRATPPAAPPTYAPTPGTHPRHAEPFLVCTRTREASGNYAAYNPAGPYMGAYQFLQSTWNSAANHADRPDLIGVPPSTASPFDQDEVAWSLYQWQGSRPWGGNCDPE